jgi:hypothetical protein
VHVFLFLKAGVLLLKEDKNMDVKNASASSKRGRRKE